MKTYRLLPILLIAVSAASCATIFNRPTTPAPVDTFEISDTKSNPKLQRFRQRGNFNIHYYLPSLRILSSYYPLRQRYTDTGYGLAVGLEYTYREGKSISCSASIATTPLLRPDDNGVAECLKHSNFAILHNYIGDFYSVGLGLNLTRSNWMYSWNQDIYNSTHNEQYSATSTDLPYGTQAFNNEHWSIGTECNLYFFSPTCPNIQIGITYCPTATLRPVVGARRYEHTISLGIRINGSIIENGRLNRRPISDLFSGD